jgi:hypothetical protein
VNSIRKEKLRRQSVERPGVCARSGWAENLNCFTGRIASSDGLIVWAGCAVSSPRITAEQLEATSHRLLAFAAEELDQSAKLSLKLAPDL